MTCSREFRLHRLVIQESTSFFTYQSPLQRRLSVYNWNPGPRRGTEDSIDKQIAGKWHFIISEEASDYVDHTIQHERFHVTHFAGCAVLFNKDTLYTNVDVKSIHSHDTRRVLHDHTFEGEHGWGYMVLCPRASFRRAAASGQTVITVFSLHNNNVFAKKEVLPRKSSMSFVFLRSPKTLFWLRVTPMVRHGVVAAVTFSVLLMRLFADCALRTPPRPHTDVGSQFHSEQSGVRSWFS